MSDAKPPSPPGRPARARDETPAPVPDPADLGTAYGMELSIGGLDTSASSTPDDDPLHWIRRWLDRHTQS